MSLISIITVNFNQPEATLALLKSISAYDSVFELEIIVVDNGSKENPELLLFGKDPLKALLEL